MIDKKIPDFDLLKIIKNPSNNDEFIEARDALWHRYYHFTEKHFFQWRQSIIDAGMEKDDFMGEAFSRYLYCLDKVDLKKMEEKNVKKFGTIYHNYLYAIKNKCDEYINNVLNVTTHFSQYDKEDCDMSVEDYENEVSNKMAVDFDTQYESHLARKIISEYRKIEDDPDKIEMLNMLLDGYSVNKIVTTFSNRMNGYQTKKNIKLLFSKIKTIAIANCW